MPSRKRVSACAIDLREVDAEHGAIFEVADRLERVSMADPVSPEVEKVTRELAAHIRDHFSHEERLMRSTGYGFYLWHKRQHTAATAKLRLMEARIRRGDRQAAAELLDYLRGWLAQHIQLTDRMLSAHLRNYQRARAALAS